MSNVSRIVHRNIHGWTSREPRPRKPLGVTLYTLTQADGSRALHAFHDEAPAELPYRCAVRVRPYLSFSARALADEDRLHRGVNQFSPSLFSILVEGDPGQLRLRPVDERVMAALAVDGKATGRPRDPQRRWHKRHVASARKRRRGW